MFPIVKTEIVRIVAEALGRPERHITHVVNICTPLSCDVRDVIFVVRGLSDDVDKPVAVVDRQVMSKCWFGVKKICRTQRLNFSRLISDANQRGFFEFCCVSDAEGKSQRHQQVMLKRKRKQKTF
jgi:hypothetical protein